MSTLLQKPVPRKIKPKKLKKGKRLKPPVKPRQPSRGEYRRRVAACLDLLNNLFWPLMPHATRGEKLSVLLKMNEIEVWGKDERRTWIKTREIFEGNRARL